jgi:AraC-like DNA-binding protein
MAGKTSEHTASSKTIEQIERAKQATALLGQGVSLIDVAYQTGYADRSHLTRALKHFIGYTPALIARTKLGLSELLTLALCGTMGAISQRTGLLSLCAGSFECR